MIRDEILTKKFAENTHEISISSTTGDHRHADTLHHLRCTCGYYLKTSQHTLERVEEIAAEHKIACDRQYAKRRQDTTDRRIADYREERDICLAARAKWHATPLGPKHKSVSGVRRMEFRRWRDRVEGRIEILRDLEGIDYRDIDAADGVDSIII